MVIKPSLSSLTEGITVRITLGLVTKRARLSSLSRSMPNSFERSSRSFCVWADLRWFKSSVKVEEYRWFLGKSGDEASNSGFVRDSKRRLVVLPIRSFNYSPSQRQHQDHRNAHPTRRVVSMEWLTRTGPSRLRFARKSGSPASCLISTRKTELNCPW